MLITYLLTDYIELSFNFIENKLETICLIKRLIPKSLVIYFLNTCNSISKDVCLVPQRFLLPGAMFLIEIWDSVGCAFLCEVGLAKKNTTHTHKQKQKQKKLYHQLRHFSRQFSIWRLISVKLACPVTNQQCSDKPTLWNKQKSSDLSYLLSSML